MTLEHPVHLVDGSGFHGSHHLISSQPGLLITIIKLLPMLVFIKKKMEIGKQFSRVRKETKNAHFKQQSMLEAGKCIFAVDI